MDVWNKKWIVWVHTKICTILKKNFQLGKKYSLIFRLFHIKICWFWHIAKCDKNYFLCNNIIFQINFEICKKFFHNDIQCCLGKHIKNRKINVLKNFARLWICKRCGIINRCFFQWCCWQSYRNFWWNHRWNNRLH